MATSLPAITVSEADFERLERLVETPEARQTPALDGLRRELARARILPADRIPTGTVVVNTVVRLIDELSGEEHRVELVWPRAADGTAGKVSVLAPMGSALLGLSAGQTIDWQVPGGRHLRLKVLEVDPVAGDAGKHGS